MLLKSNEDIKVSAYSKDFNKYCMIEDIDNGELICNTLVLTPLALMHMM